MIEEFNEILSGLIGEKVKVNFKSGYEHNGIENSLILNFMLCKRLERMADALESIQKCLEDITSDHSLSVYANGSINVD